ncbi:hypothetical protein CUMW_187020 [Citrus unshiu]|uniref:non-specific serine/threonine protein kinase n=1 Tax=Citrus unshiu TaxID=55188 RepID=A0A2H5Q1J6_CITUN|nr:hypothetical protein CUMW_187020 [Citrus unshiu]
MAKRIHIFLLIVYLLSKSKAQSPQSNKNITPGSTLNTNSTPNFWLSASGRFAFGFYPSGNGFRVGIWIVGSSSPTNNTIVVWTARREDPVVSSGAALQFSVDGSRVLLRNSNDEVQSIAELNKSAVAASMLDSGNFVLYDSGPRIVWASFDQPTDTLLVGQKLSQNTALRSSTSLTNQSQRPQDGCKLNFPTGDDCLEDQGSNIYNISHLEKIYWEPDEYELINLIPDEEACSNACLGDCNCVVATYDDPVCYKLKLPLRFGMKNDSSGIKSLVKVRIGGFPKARDRIVNKKVGKEFLVVGIVLIAFSLIVLTFALYILCAHHKWSYGIIPWRASPPDVVQEISLRSFSYEQLVSATENFKEEIGRGGSGRVFKGYINGGKEIAVKKLIKLVEEGEMEFRNEMKIIGRTHHKNLVHLVGFCSEGSNRLLVYEFMKNGSLGDLLFKSEERVNWSERRRIALEIANGLHYLHDECETRIIHCDIKPQNILMDESRTAKISDFGLSKLLKPDQTRTYTMARGTRGYAAPEWYNNNAPITSKADVYSFGVMLLEIICCRKKVDASLRDEEVVLVDWVYQCYRAGELQLLKSEELDASMEEFEKMVKIGLWCVEPELSLRPAMKQVISMMEGIVVTPPPLSYSSVRG